MKFLNKICVCLIAMIGVFSCQKNAGPGGNSTITGKIFVQDYKSDGSPKFVLNSSGVLQRVEYFAQDQDVFITYGDGALVPNAKVSTGPNGVYEFKYLAKGKYQIYTYGKSFDLINDPSGQTTKIFNVEITKKKSTIEVATDTIKN